MTAPTTGPSTPQSPGLISPSLVLEELARIVQHPLFANSPSLRAFLEFAVTKTLAGAHEEIKEYTIATQVLGRSENFDTRDTSLVRTKAFNVRTKLKAYYATDGDSDPVRIVLEPGSYIPLFKLAPPRKMSPAFPRLPQTAVRLVILKPAPNLPDTELQLQLDSFLSSLAVSLVQAGRFEVATASNQAVTQEDTADRCDLIIQFHFVRSNNQLQIQLRAERGPQNYVVWARDFSWPKEAFDPSRAASEVAWRLARTLTGASPAASYAPNARVSAACEEGYSFLSRNNPIDCHRAQRRFEAGIDLDPKSAAAHAGFALAVLNGTLLGDAGSALLTVDAEVSALAALALDRQSSYSQLARGAALAVIEWDCHAAQKYLDRAEQLQERPDPRFSSWIALVKLLPQRRYAEAIKLLTPILDIFPSNLFCRFVLGTALRLDRHYAEALAVFSESFSYDSHCGFAALNMANTHAALGDLEKAQETLHLAQNDLGRTAPIIGLEGYLAGLLGKHDLVTDLNTELAAMATPSANHFFEGALAALALGETNRAISLLETSLRAQEAAAFLGRLDPLLEPLHGTPVGSLLFNVF